MFNTGPISVSFVSEIESLSLTGILQGLSSTDEKPCAVDIAFPDHAVRSELVPINMVEPRLVWLAFDPGSIPAYSQYRSPSSRITVSSTAT